MANEPDSLYKLLGAFDNLHEPQPPINRPEAIMGIVITFMVSCPGFPLGRLPLITSQDNIVDMRCPTHIH
jgi:hypothetical protein